MRTNSHSHRRAHAAPALALAVGMIVGGCQNEQSAPAAPAATNAGGPAAPPLQPAPAPGTEVWAEGSLATSVHAVAATPPPPLDAVAVDGVRGELVESRFLVDAGDGRRSLVLVDWEIPAGVEQYLCGRVTATEDAYLNAYHPVSPPGTHHTAVSVLEKPDEPDGVIACEISEVGTRNIVGAGIGTASTRLPDGIAMKVAAGNQLVLNLHLFNFTDAPLRGRSGTLAETIDPARVQQLADGVAVGPLKLRVPPGRSTQHGVCTVDRDYTVFGVFPHMHEMGVHMKVVAQRAAGGEVVLHDGPYSFESQESHRLAPLELKVGDQVAIECTYENTTDATLNFGESTKDEMCIAGLVRYPAGGKTACPF